MSERLEVLGVNVLSRAKFRFQVEFIIFNANAVLIH